MQPASNLPAGGEMRFQKIACTSLIIALFTTCTVGASGSLSDSPKSRKPHIAGQASADCISKRLIASAGIVESEQKSESSTALLENYLRAGKLADGEAALSTQLKTHPRDDQLRYGLGVLQFLRAVERLSQDLYRYGPRGKITQEFHIPILRVQVAENPHPETLTYLKARKVVQTFVDKLGQAEATLASIDSADVKLPLHFGMIRMDLNGGGRLDENETLWKLYAGLTHQEQLQPSEAENFIICFDRGDVHWLRAYCHLLMGMCQAYLAYDTRETFDCTAHMFFSNVESPYGFLTRGKHVFSRHGDEDVLDIIAFIHLIRWPVAEPQRMEESLHHLEAMVAQNKIAWKWIMAETDDDHEWIPNPAQTGVIRGVRVTADMVNAWTELMNLGGKVLAGELLIPFWRGDDGRGVNLRKVFLEPRAFDLVLWVQGSAAAPYLQSGEKVRVDTWRKLQLAFGNEFPGFAVWFN